MYQTTPIKTWSCLGNNVNIQVIPIWMKCLKNTVKILHSVNLKTILILNNALCSLEYEDSPSVDGYVSVHSNSCMRKPSLWFLAANLKPSPQTSTCIKEPNIIVIFLVSNPTNHIDLQIIK